MSDEQVYAVRCPFCLARPGNACVERGKRLTYTHPERRMELRLFGVAQPAPAAALTEEDVRRIVREEIRAHEQEKRRKRRARAEREEQIEEDAYQAALGWGGQE